MNHYFRNAGRVVFIVVFWTWLIVHARVHAQQIQSAETQQTAEAKQQQSDSQQQVTTLRMTWTDTSRQREIPVTIRFVETTQTPMPVIIFSHGLGGSRDHYEYLSLHWAKAGYMVVHPQHLGSDDAVWRQSQGQVRQSLTQAMINPANRLNRPRDVKFVISEIIRLNGDEQSPLYGKADADRIGMAGHSFGAYTTLAVGGMAATLPGGRRVSLMDSRVKALLPMSAPADSRQRGLVTMFEPIALPCLHMTGTNDQSIIGQTTAADRRMPFDQMHRADNYLLILKDGDHMVFSQARQLGRDVWRDAIHVKMILDASTAFWNAYLKADEEALQWLQDEQGFKKQLGKEGTFEVKKKTSE